MHKNEGIMLENNQFMDSIVSSGLKGKALANFLQSHAQDVVGLDNKQLNKLLELGVDKTALLNIALKTDFAKFNQAGMVKQQHEVVKFLLKQGADVGKVEAQVSQWITHKDLLLNKAGSVYSIKQLHSTPSAQNEAEAAKEGEFLKILIDKGVDLNKQVGDLLLSHTSLKVNQEILFKGGLTGENFLKAVLHSPTPVDSTNPDQIKLYVDLFDKAAEHGANLDNAVYSINYSKPLADALLADQEFHKALTHDINKYLFVVKQDAVGGDQSAVIKLIEKAFAETHSNITEDLHSGYSKVAAYFDASTFAELVKAHPLDDVHVDL